LQCSCHGMFVYYALQNDCNVIDHHHYGRLVSVVLLRNYARRTDTR
jgi:hypothetical protein